MKDPTLNSVLKDLGQTTKKLACQNSFNKHSHFESQILCQLNKNESNNHCKVGNSDSAHKAPRISQHTPSTPNLFTRPGVAVNTWQTPKSQRCRKLLCQGEHVIHLFSHTCLSFVSFVSLTLCLFALCHFQCQHKLFLYIIQTQWFG